MKKTLIVIACALWVVLTVTYAGADPITLNFDSGDPYYVGQVIDGIPSSLALEAVYINTLKGLPAGQTALTIGTESYNRVGSILAGLLPPVTEAQLTKLEVDPAADTTVTAAGYVLGKYDASNPGAGGYVWYVPAGTYVVPGFSPDTWDPTKGKWVSYGLSHVTYEVSVPEPGILILLGIAMSAIGAASWKISKL